MKVTPVDPGIDLNFAAEPRTIGRIHASDVYNDMYLRLQPEKYGQDIDVDTREAYMAGGLVLERFLERGWKERFQPKQANETVERPGELIDEQTGIVYSPDLIIFNGVTRVGEMKLTWMSTTELPREEANGFPKKFNKYITQMAQACHSLETSHARLIAFFVNSSYSWTIKGTKKPNPKAFKPEILAWDITFTKRELQDEWDRFIRHARFMGVI